MHQKDVQIHHVMQVTDFNSKTVTKHEQGIRRLHFAHAVHSRHHPPPGSDEWSVLQRHGVRPTCCDRVTMNCRVSGAITLSPATGDAAYRQYAGQGPSHGHRQHAQKFGKDRARGVPEISRRTDRQTNRHTQRQTQSSQYFATALAGEVMRHTNSQIPLR